MIKEQIEARGIKDPHTLMALRQVDRCRFVPPELIPHAEDDRPLPIGFGQTISQPYIVAFMTEAIRPRPGQKILEIGTGSGYQAAVLSRIVDRVYSIEIHPPLAQQARERMQLLGYDNVHIREVDGYHGWPEEAPFDAIIVTAAAEAVPPPLIDQLKEGGRLIIPLGSTGETQQLTLIKKTGSQTTVSRLLPVRFVPFTRKTDT